MDLRGFTPRFGIPAAFLLGAISMFVGPAGPAAPQGAASKVAAVDIDRVLREYAPAKQRQAEFNKGVDAIQAELESLKAQIDEASGELQNLQKGSLDYAKAAMEVQIRQARREKSQELLEGELSRRRLELSVALYDEINTGIAAFAAAKDLDIVLRARTSPPGASATTRFDINQMRDVLCVASAADLTNDVIAFLKGWAPPANGGGEKH